MAFQCRIERDGILRYHRLVVIGQHQESGRRVCRHMLFVGIGFNQSGITVLPNQAVARAHVGICFLHGDHGIEQQHEIRPTAECFHRVGSTGISRIKARTCRCCQVPTGRRTGNPDLCRINPPFTGIHANHPHGPSGIRRGYGMVSVRHAVFQHNAGYPLFIEPFGHLETFMVHGQHLVTASRTNQHGSTGINGLFGQIDKHFGFRYVPYPDSLKLLLRSRQAIAFGRSVGPHLHFQGLGIC